MGSKPAPKINLLFFGLSGGAIVISRRLHFLSLVAALAFASDGSAMAAVAVPTPTANPACAAGSVDVAKAHGFKATAEAELQLADQAEASGDWQAFSSDMAKAGAAAEAANNFMIMAVTARTSCSGK